MDGIRYLKNRYQQRQKVLGQLHLFNKVKEVLSSNFAPNTKRAEINFDNLQKSRNQPKEYGYTPSDIWKRGVQRSLEIMELIGFDARIKNVLEVGCGDGMVGKLLSTYGHCVTLMDNEDWRDARTEGLPFIQYDISTNSGLSNICQKKFDLIFSYNAFEHFIDPAKALENIENLCSNNGFIYLQFDPLYSAPWGLHAHGTLNMPYPQFLFSHSFLNEKLKEIGIRYYGKKQSELIAVNGWKVEQYQNLWLKSGLEVCWENKMKDFSHLEIVLQYPEAFFGRALSFDDLTITGIQTLLRKRK